MANKPLQITTPVGRLVGGSIYEPRTTDYEGKPLVVKTGANAGQSRVDYAFGVAIPKTPGVTHWAQEAWGQPIYNMAVAAFPNGETQRLDFAWKITDGDSTIPNKRGAKPCDREGHKGHWIIWFSGGSAPRVYNANGTQIIAEPGAVKLGYYVQVFGNVVDNKPSASPGIYVNHTYVALSAYGEEITVGPDVSAAGFGAGVALPPGASMTPPATFNAPAMPPVFNAPPVAPAIAVVPNPAILAVPGAPIAPPPVPVAPPAAPVRQMTASAGGATYEQMIAGGWTDALLIQHGHMLG